MAARNSYRSFYASFWDDADVQALSHLAYRVLTTLKGTLPAAGIGSVMDEVIAPRCGCSLEQLAAAYAELEAVKGQTGRGWILRERGVVWIVNGLRNEPNIKATDVKHRQHVVDTLTPLGGVDSPLAIVQAFKLAYREWFPGSLPATSPTSIDQRPVADSISGSDRRPVADETKDHIKGPSARALVEGLGSVQDKTETIQNKPTPARERASGGDDQEAPVPSGTAPSVTVPPGPISYITQCVVALNAGMHANPHVRAFREIAASTQSHVVTWEADGVPIEVALAAIAEGCESFRPRPGNRQINTLKYFEGPVDRRMAVRAPGGATSGVTTDSALDRARVIYAIAKDFNLLHYGGNADEYQARREQAARDPRAGPRFLAEILPLKLSTGIGNQANDHYAAMEIARRIQATAGQVA